ncbi:MAG TPA: Tad domain-containing protein [Pleomorphomonadaceae bacterium]|nr:Tad domain-containing protein [Pleomorphomonadaceae bacterium]
MRGDKGSGGQILVVAAAALVILLGIAALIVDLGFGVLLRRQEQNAVDPGAVAAARFIDDITGQTIDMPMAWAAACHYARQNDFFPTALDNGSGATGCAPANDPHGALLEVVYPPDSRADQFQGHLGMVQIVLTRQRDTFFGRLLGVGSLTVSTDAVAARQRGATNTHSLIALADTGCATGHIHGTGSVEIYPAPGFVGPGGYVQVNSDCDSGSGDDLCGPGNGALKVDGTSDLTAPKINVHGSCQNKQPNGILDEAATQVGDPLGGLIPPLIDTSVDGQTCGSGGWATQATGSQSNGCGNNPMDWFPSPDINCPGMIAGYTCVELQPGVYYGGWDLKGDKIHLKLAPGIYIIAGGGIKLTTDSISSVSAAGALPAPVLFFNTDNPAATCPGSSSGCQSDLTLGTANSTLKITGLLGNVPCPPITTVGGCPFGGMVIWYDADGSEQYDGLVHVEGGGGLYISGTIYAPKAHVKIEGNSGTNCGTGSETQFASVQIISWTWDIGGSGDLCMPYDPTQLYHLSLQGLVH